MLSANDIWAVGYVGNFGSYQTLVAHWDGIGWGIIPSPSPGSGNNYLTNVVALSNNDVWAVGHAATGGVYRTLIEHWNGTNWSVVTSPNSGPGDITAGAEVLLRNGASLQPLQRGGFIHQW